MINLGIWPAGMQERLEHSLSLDIHLCIVSSLQTPALYGGAQERRYIVVRVRHHGTKVLGKIRDIKIEERRPKTAGSEYRYSCMHTYNIKRFGLSSTIPYVICVVIV